MKLVALMPVRNEAWCLGLSLRVALMWCDEVVVFLHACTDASLDIAMRVATSTNRVTVVGRDDPTWDEMTHRQALLELARVKGRPDAPDGPGATHIALVDADEVLTANLVPVIRGWCERLNARDLVQRRLELPLFNMRGGCAHYHANGIWGDRWTTVAFEDSPKLYWGGDRFHHREPMGQQLIGWRPAPLRDAHDAGGVMHLWGSNEKRLRAKHALYKITEALRWPDKPIAEIERYYSQAVYSDPTHVGLAADSKQWTFKTASVESWWRPYEELVGAHLDLNAEPWQTAECERLVQEHGRDRFRGLDLFGVV